MKNIEHEKRRVRGSLMVACMLALAPAALADELDPAALTAAKLRQYCRACHGVGPLRFIHDEGDAALWSYIKQNNVPGTSRLWIEAIIDVLRWPADTPPPFDELKDPATGRDWMPKGVKRTQLAADETEGAKTRRLMLDSLNAARP